MNKKIRYILLAVGFLIFASLAPILVFFTQGLRLDTERKRFNQTGILAVKTLPSDAEVLLNGEKKDTTPTSIRFLKPGEYTVTIKKDGFLDWTKKLEIKPGRVTWANPNPNRITLLKSDLKQKIISGNAIAFTLAGKSVYYLDKNKNLVKLFNTDLSGTTTTLMPAVFSEISNLDDQTLLLKNKNSVFIFDTESGNFSDITKFITTDSKIIRFESGVIWYVSASTLYSFDIKSKIRTIILANTTAGAYVDNIWYIAKNSKTDSSLLLIRNLTKPEEAEKLADLPKLSNTELLVTTQKQVFVLNDGVLYRVNPKLESLASNVSEWHYFPATNSLVFSSQNELSYYNFDENSVKLISRSNEQFSNTYLDPILNFVFFIQNNSIKALELDNRDRQNLYSLATLKNTGKFTFSNDMKSMFILDGEQLSYLTIR